MHRLLQSLAFVTAMNAHEICGHALSPRNYNQELSNPEVASNTLSPHTTRSINETRTNDNDVHCVPVYGQNLQISSCQDAIAHIPNTDARVQLDGVNIFSSCKPLCTSMFSSGYIVEH